MAPRKKRSNPSANPAAASPDSTSPTSKRPRTNPAPATPAAPVAGPSSSAPVDSPVSSSRKSKGRGAGTVGDLRLNEAQQAEYIAFLGPHALTNFNFINSGNVDDLITYDTIGPEPQPSANQAKIAKKDEIAKCGVLSTAYRYENLRNFEPIMNDKPKWWDEDWSFQQWPDQDLNAEVLEDRKRRSELENKTRITGSTLFLPLTAQDFPNITAMVVLGFRNIPALLTYFDTSVGDYFGHLARLQKWPTDTFISNALLRWEDVAACLNECIAGSADQNRALSILTAVSELEEFRPIVIRTGDVDPLCEQRMKPPISIAMTVLVAVLQFLKFSPIGPTSSVPRYTRDTTGRTSFLGFSGDQWAGGLFAYNFFVNGRRNGKLQLVSSRCPAEAKEKDCVVPRIAVLEFNKILSAEESGLVPANPRAVEKMVYAAELQQSRQKADQVFGKRARKLAKLSATQSLELRISNRMLFMATLGKANILSRENIGKVAEGHSAKDQLVQRDPIDLGSLAKILKIKQQNFAPPREYTSDRQGLQTMANGSQINDFARQAFLAEASGFMERLESLVENDQEDFAEKDGHKALMDAVRHQYDLSQMMNKLQPKDSTFMQDAESFGFVKVCDRICRRAWQFYHESAKFFGTLIKPWLFYGSPKDVGRDPALKERILTQEDFEAKLESCINDPYNPENLLHVFITSYQTGTKRWMDSRTRFLEKGEPVPDASDFEGVQRRSGHRYQGKFGAEGQATGDDEVQLEDTFDPDEHEETVEQEKQRGLRDASDNPNESFLIGWSQDLATNRRKKDGAKTRTYTEHVLRFLSFERYKEFKFERVICDEVHVCKNVASTNSRMVCLLPKKAFFGMSATPTINNIHDVVGLVAICRTVASVPLDFSRVPIPSTVDELREWSPLEDASVWKDCDDEKRAGIISWCDEHKHPLWYLHPRLVGLVKAQPTDIGQEVFAGISDMLMTRRTMATALTLPDGRMCFPGADIPPTTFTTMEVGHSGQDRERISMLVDFFLKKLWVSSSDDTDAYLPDYGDGPKPRPTEIKMDYSIARILVLISTDARNADLLAAEDEMAAAKIEDIQAAFAKKSVSLATQRPSWKTYQKQKRQAQKEKKIALGVEHIAHLIENDPDGGISYEFMTLNPPDVVPYSNRLELFAWKIARSPVYAAAFDLFLKWYNEKERVLLVVFNQATQQSFFSMFELLGFKVETIRANYTPAERQAALAKFTNPSKNPGCDVFIQNGATTFAGLNLHSCYCRGIIVQSPNNLETQNQVAGRLIRVGQGKPVIWVKIVCQDTYHQSLELRQIKKFLPQARAEAMIPESITNIDLQNLVACELLKIQWSLPFNRWPWLSYTPTPVAEWSTKRYRDFGDAASMIARLVCSLQPQEYTAELMDRLGFYLDDLVKAWGSAQGRGEIDLAKITWENVNNFLAAQPVTEDEKAYLAAADDRKVKDETKSALKREKRARHPKGKGKRKGKGKAKAIKSEEFILPEDDLSDDDAFSDDDTKTFQNVDENIQRNSDMAASMAVAALAFQPSRRPGADSQRHQFATAMNSFAQRLGEEHQHQTRRTESAIRLESELNFNSDSELSDHDSDIDMQD
ncbi:hypothetical protein E8E14_001246 [Neopestalotiopsis sp. 37M]|nr:hypothetical protein E8E14_001246 [Neopestalotiopsis sp. 37M]